MGTKNSSRKHILVVEDDPPAKEACARYLDYCGFDVAAVADAEAALQSAVNRIPWVVVCDWHLGGGANGVEVARTLQSTYGVRVIFMTAYPLDEIKDAASGIDVHAFLTKPLSLAKLAEAVESAPT